MYRHEDITRAAYQTLRQFLHEEENQHLKSLKEEGFKMFKQLEKRRAKMIAKMRSLRAMYEELMDVCHKPDAELLQVGIEHAPGNILLLGSPGFSLSGTTIYFFISHIYGWEGGSRMKMIYIDKLQLLIKP